MGMRGLKDDVLIYWAGWIDTDSRNPLDDIAAPTLLL